MAYRGPQEQAQGLAPPSNNGNPNGVHNVSFDNKNYRYTPPTVDNSGRVTNSDLLNFNLPRFGNQAPLMGLPNAINASEFLRDMFPDGSMVPGGGTRGRLDLLLQGRGAGAPPRGGPAQNIMGTRPGGAPALNFDNPMGNPTGPVVNNGTKPADAMPSDPTKPFTASNGTVPGDPTMPGHPRTGGAPGQNINWQGNNSGVQDPVVPNNNWSILQLLANQGDRNIFDWVRQFRDQRLASEGNGSGILEGYDPGGESRGYV